MRHKGVDIYLSREVEVGLAGDKPAMTGVQPRHKQKQRTTIYAFYEAVGTLLGTVRKTLLSVPAKRRGVLLRPTESHLPHSDSAPGGNKWESCVMESHGN